MADNKEYLQEPREEIVKKTDEDDDNDDNHHHYQILLTHLTITSGNLNCGLN